MINNNQDLKTTLLGVIASITIYAIVATYIAVTQSLVIKDLHFQLDELDLKHQSLIEKCSDCLEFQ